MAGPQRDTQRGTARRALHARLRRENRDYVPPPDDPRERRLERLGLLAIFAVFAAAILALLIFEG